MTTRQELALKTRKHLIESARDVISQKGFDETSILDITEKAGVAKGTFYTYFKSKEEIIEELIATQFIRFDDKFLNKSLSEKIEEYSSLLLHQIEDPGLNICRQWIINNIKPTEPDKIGYDIKSICLILESSKSNGELTSDLPIDILAKNIASYYYGLMLSWVMTDGVFNPLDEITSINAFITNILKPYIK